MKTSDFYYDLPQELIAQTPAEPRESSRLMLLDKKTGAVGHRHFYDLIDYLNPGDCLILNDTRVIPARIYGTKKETGAYVEFLLLKQSENNVWECLCKPGKRAKPGTVFSFGDGLVDAEVLDVTEDGNRIIQFDCDSKEIYNVLDKIGKMPLPPYITEELKNGERYQTVYSRERGSAAAPTAGLHFTDRVFEALEKKGVKKVFLTLHVGAGTFLPVKVEDTENHKMHAEYGIITEQACDIINEAKKQGKKIVAVGTTSLRLLETAGDDNGILHPFTGETSIFITPGYKFKIIDYIITNFHLPKSTLFMLICAIAGIDRMKNAYHHAMTHGYHFYSYGDSSILKCVNKI